MSASENSAKETYGREARWLCQGSVEEIGHNAAKVLELHFCNGWNADGIAHFLLYPIELTESVIKQGPSLLDTYNYARLVSRGKGFRH